MTIMIIAAVLPLKLPRSAPQSMGCIPTALKARFDNAGLLALSFALWLLQPRGDFF